MGEEIAGFYLGEARELDEIQLVAERFADISPQSPSIGAGSIHVACVDFGKGTAVPEICRFLGIVITMYFDDHDPPHFHVRYGEFRARFGIKIWN